MPRRHLINAHCFGAYRRPRLTDDDGTRGATANQADSGEGRCTNPEKFHTKLTSRGTAKSRFNFVAAAVQFLELESAIRKIALTLYLRRWQSRGRVKSIGRGDPEVHPTLFLQGSTVDDGFCTNN